MAFLLLAAAFFALGLVLFFPNARYRAPLIPLLAPAAAWTLREGARSLRLVRTQGGRALLAPALPLALGLLLVDGGWVRAVDSPADQSFQRSTFLAEQGKTDAALSELTRATTLNRNSEEAWETLAALYGKSGRYREAAEAARTATGLDSTDAQAWDDLGLARLGLLSSRSGNGPAEDGNPAEIEACFRTALRLDPGRTTARLQLQGLLLHRGETDAARALLRQGLDRAPQSAPLWTALGGLELHAGRWAEAVSALERAVHLGPDDAEAWNQYALALIQAGRRDEALQALDQVLKLRPGNPQAVANRQRLLQLR
jgi:Flp pilus assembly protein TadD